MKRPYLLWTEKEEKIVKKLIERFNNEVPLDEIQKVFPYRGVNSLRSKVKALGGRIITRHFHSYEPDEKALQEILKVEKIKKKK